MRYFLVGMALLTGLFVVFVDSSAEAQTCIRDYRGRVICGAPIHRGYRGGGYHADHRYHGVPVVGRPRPQGSVRCDYYGRCYRSAPHSCGNPGYTIQDGVCKPYRGY
jgi:hypothetical protein